MINEYIRRDLRNFTPYHAPLKEYDIKLDANENPYLHDEKILNKVKEWLNDCNNIRRYPDTDCNELRNVLANFWQVEKDNVVCGVGSDQLIDCILKVFLEPGDKVLMPTPSFSMYKLATVLNRGIPVEFSLNDDFSYDVNKILDLYNEIRPKCVFICTPNNPTGNIMTIEDIEKLLQKIECPLIIDEAYSEYIDDTMIGKFREYDNLIVLKTFSKAYGLAGLRVGYGIASKSMIDAINIVIPPYHLNALSQFLAKIVIENSEQYDKKSKEIVNNRKWLIDNLKEIYYVDKVYPSHANYLLIKVSDNDIAKKLEKHKILVRGYGEQGELSNCIRITVGTEEENEQLIKVMKIY
ncbi:histidinol-phosphate transaminase [Vallitalea sp.]|jgi:histidinol-phosphate aminotransferase|uniref:histidinol-phosphate transaminase n=1 Tax=Vallitalea sp. TaxID=1882829 RepID=UPI0025E76FB2|nr:histidinol-phosphate transaminase [Vallitalea sp.]MCT4688033.1 histidinol-phosphate transaminase [Vallitalea sp.]